MYIPLAARRTTKALGEIVRGPADYRETALISQEDRVEQIQTGRADSFRARHSDCPLTRLCKVRILTA